MPQYAMLVRPLAVLVLALGLASPLVGCRRSDDARADLALADALPRLTLDEVSALLDESRAGGRPVYVFDTNDKELFDSGHVPGAIWVPWDGLPAAALPADKAAKLVFYCSNES